MLLLQEELFEAVADCGMRHGTLMAAVYSGRRMAILGRGQGGGDTLCQTIAHAAGSRTVHQRVEKAATATAGGRPDAGTVARGRPRNGRLADVAAVAAYAVGAARVARPDVTKRVFDAGLNGLRIRDEFEIYDLVLVEAGKDVCDTASEQL